MIMSYSKNVTQYEKHVLGLSTYEHTTFLDFKLEYYILSN